MQRKIVIISVIGFGLLVILHLLAFDNLEIIGETQSAIFNHIFWGLLCLFLTLIGIFLPKDSLGQFGRIYVLLGLSALAIIWTIGTMLSPFTQTWTDYRVLYVKKDNPKIQIIQQVFYAGATGSDVYDTIVVKGLANNIRWKDEFNQSNFHPSDWIEVKKPY